MGLPIHSQETSKQASLHRHCSLQTSRIYREPVVQGISTLSNRFGTHAESTTHVLPRQNNWRVLLLVAVRMLQCTCWVPGACI